MRALLRRWALRFRLGSLNGKQLPHDVGGMLIRDARNLIIALTCLPVAPDAGSDILLRYPGLEHLASAIHLTWFGRVRGNKTPRRLCGIVRGQTLYLLVRKVPAQAPHVLEVRGIGPIVCTEAGQLLHEIRLCLGCNVRKVGQIRITVSAVAIGADLQCQRTCWRTRIGGLARAIYGGTACEG